MENCHIDEVNFFISPQPMTTTTVFAVLHLPISHDKALLLFMLPFFEIPTIQVPQLPIPTQGKPSNTM